MGQSQSPSKFCARPSSTMFQNNLALKIKDSAFKKHLSKQAFVRSSNLRDIDSKYSKSSDSEKSSCNASNLKSPKQDFKKKKQTQFSNNYNFTDTVQGVHLSDIQQNEAEYEDEQTRKINKTYVYATQKGADKSRKASDEQLGLQESKKQSIQQGTKIKKESSHQRQKCQKQERRKQLKINEQKQLKLSDYDQSNLILFTESKKVSSCKSNEQQHGLKSHKGSQVINIDSKYNSNLQIESNKSPSKHHESGTETYVNLRDSVKVDKKRSENEEFRPFIETRIKSRKAPQVGNAEISDQKLQKTIINSRKTPYKDQNSITIKVQNLYKTTHHDNQNKNKSYEQHLFRSCKKVYASQISLDSELSPPQSQSDYKEKQAVRIGVNKLINSKIFQEDFSIKKDSGHDRKSNRQKIRDSISLGKVRKKLVESMHQLHLHQETQTKGLSGNSDQSENRNSQQKNIRKNGSRLSLSSRLRSKIRQKISLSKTHSEKSSFSSQQRLSQTNMGNSIQKLRNSRKSVRQVIKRMNEDQNQRINNLQTTQDNYFNENIDDNTLSPVMYDLRKNKNESKLKQSIVKQTMRTSEYEITANAQENTQRKQKITNLNESELAKSKSKIKIQNRNKNKGILMFTENPIDKFQESTLEKTNNHISNKKPQTKEQDSRQKIQDKKYKSPRRTEKNPQDLHNSPNYLKPDILKNHISVQYLNKKNPQPQDKKPLNHIKFSQLEPNPFDIIQSEKLIKATSTKNYPFHENSKITTNSNLKNSTAQNIQIIDKLINNPRNSKSKSKKQFNRNDDYEAFVQDLQKLKKIKEIQQKLIQQNLENLKKSGLSHNKVSILDLNKQAMNQQITMKVERMNKMKELNKLTKKMDPAMLMKSKSSQLLRQEYENLSKTGKIQQKRTDRKHQNPLQKGLYYNFSKQISNLSHLKDMNQKDNSKAFRSHKQLNTSSQQYMIEVSRVHKTKNLKTSRMDSLKLACIPESPQIKYNPWKEYEKGCSMIRKQQKKESKYGKVETFANQASRLMDMNRIRRSREQSQAVSLQKTRDKRKLILF